MQYSIVQYFNTCNRFYDHYEQMHSQQKQRNTRHFGVFVQSVEAAEFDTLHHNWSQREVSSSGICTYWILFQIQKPRYWMYLIRNGTRQSQANIISHATVISAVWAKHSPEDATAQGSDRSKIRSSVATNRMDVIFQKRIKKGLAI